MAHRTKSRLDLRREVEQAEALQTTEGGDATEAKPKTKRAAKPKTTRSRSAKTKAPVRMRVRWAVYNDHMKQIAVFDYPQRADADKKVKELMDAQKGHHFVLAIREPMPVEAPAE